MRAISQTAFTFALFCFSIANHVCAQGLDYLFYGGVTCTGGASISSVTAKPTGGCGLGINALAFIYTEVGVMGPLANGSNVAGYISNDLLVPLPSPGSSKSRPKWTMLPLQGRRWEPIVLVGYTYMFGIAHAVDYGAGFDWGLNDKRLLRVEVRDYLTFTNPAEHNVVLRVGLWTGIPD